MSGNAIFNATVCIIGIGILLIHAVNALLKKNRRKDENRLLVFLLFTAFHFLVYLIFTLVKVKYTSDAYIISFYTTFYIFNNIEILLFFLYLCLIENLFLKFHLEFIIIVWVSVEDYFPIPELELSVKLDFSEDWDMLFIRIK